jgi:hypothetical protein
MVDSSTIEVIGPAFDVDEFELPQMLGPFSLTSRAMSPATVAKATSYSRGSPPRRRSARSLSARRYNMRNQRLRFAPFEYVPTIASWTVLSETCMPASLQPAFAKVTPRIGSVCVDLQRQNRSSSVGDVFVALRAADRAAERSGGRFAAQGALG